MIYGEIIRTRVEIPCTGTTAGITNVKSMRWMIVCYSKACRLPLEIFSISSISLRDFPCADNREQSIADRRSTMADNADARKWIQHAVREIHGHRCRNVDENPFVLEMDEQGH